MSEDDAAVRDGNTEARSSHTEAANREDLGVFDGDVDGNRETISRD